MTKTMTLLLLTIVTLFFNSSVYSQDSQPDNLIIYFQVGKSDPLVLDNKAALSKIVSLLNSSTSSLINSIRIEAYASPEGKIESNGRLSQQRAEEVRKYILQHCPAISSNKVMAVGLGENWAGLRKLVEADPSTPRRKEVLAILDGLPDDINYPAKPGDLNYISNVSSGKILLKDLGESTWYYMNRHHFPQLRSAIFITVIPNEASNVSKEKEAQPESVIEPAAPASKVPEMSTVAKPNEFITKPLFALKTNLLFDAATMLNAEIEIPIGKRWSIAGEWIFPWWVLDNGKANSKRDRLELLNGNLEGRYWFGDRKDKPLLTGWFAGIYTGGGIYDFEYKRKGYQGEFFITSGLSGGFAHSIGKNLSLEYSLGLGYIKTNYRYYHAKFGVDNKWHALRQESGSYQWFGPTRAKVSLVWLLNFKTRKGASK